MVNIVNIAVFLFGILTPAVSLAFDGEYYTYGNFSTVYEALKSLSLIMSDVGWKGLFASSIALGIAWGIGKGAVGGLISGRPSIGANSILTGIGILVYLGAFSPASTGTLTVYDKTLNTFNTVTLPNGMVALMHAVSLIEDGYATMLDTSRPVGSPSVTDKNAVFALNALYSLSNVARSNDNYMQRSLYKFTDDCFSTAVAVNTSGLTHEEIEFGTVDWVSTFGKAVNPALFTVKYTSDADNVGTTTDCNDAWNTLLAYYQPGNEVTNFSKAVKDACENAGVDTSDAVQLMACTDTLDTFVNYYSNGVYPTAAAYIKQYVMGNMVIDWFKENGNSYYWDLLNQKNIYRSMGALRSYETYLPHMRGYMLALAAMLGSILLVLMPTPLYSKSAGAFFGLFIFIALWGIVDATVASIIIKDMHDMAQAVLEKGVSIRGLTEANDIVTQKLGMIGNFRGLGLGVAAALATALGVAGGYALTHIGQSISGSMTASGGEVGQLESDIGKSQAHQMLADKYRSKDWTNQGKWNAYERSLKGGWDWSMQDGLAKSNIMRKYGGNAIMEQMEWGMGSNIDAASKERAIYGNTQNKADWNYANANAEVKTFGSATNKEDYTALNLSKSVGEQKTEQAIANSLFDGDMKKYGEWKASNYTITEPIAEKFRAMGFDGVQAGMMLNMKYSSFDPESGKFVSAKFQSDDGQTSRVYEGGMVTERTHNGGLITTTVSDSNGNVISFLGQGQMKEGISLGNGITTGRGVEITSHAGQKVYTGVFMVNGKSVAGSVIDDGQGSIVFSDVQSGRSMQHKMINKHINDTRNYNASGSETITGAKTTIDNSTSVTSGTNVSGTHGVTTYDAGRQTISSMIESGNWGFAAPLTQGSSPQQFANGTVFAANWANEMKSFGDRVGIKFDEVSATASVNAGFKALGMGVGAEFIGKTGSTDKSSFNILSGGMQRVIQHARTTAASRGLTQDQAIAHDVSVYHNAVKNEFMNTSPIKDPNRHEKGNLTGNKSSAKKGFESD